MEFVILFTLLLIWFIETHLTNCFIKMLKYHQAHTTLLIFRQCEQCAPSSDSDSDDVSRGSLVTAEGRRVTRRSHRPPEKLAAVSDTDIIQQQKMVGFFCRKIHCTNISFVLYNVLKCLYFRSVTSHVQ